MITNDPDKRVDASSYARIPSLSHKAIAERAAARPRDLRLEQLCGMIQRNEIRPRKNAPGWEAVQ